MTKRFGLLISAAPQQPGFTHGLKLAEAALAKGHDVYLYCIDDAVAGLEAPLLQTLATRGLKLYACAYSVEQRRLPRTGPAIFAGLASLSDLIAGTDRFVSFN